jgi:hypothetical protein
MIGELGIVTFAHPLQLSLWGNSIFMGGEIVLCLREVYNTRRPTFEVLYLGAIYTLSREYLVAWA